MFLSDDQIEDVKVTRHACSRGIDDHTYSSHKGDKQAFVGSRRTAYRYINRPIDQSPVNLLHPAVDSEDQYTAERILATDMRSDRQGIETSHPKSHVEWYTEEMNKYTAQQYQQDADMKMKVAPRLGPIAAIGDPLIENFGFIQPTSRPASRREHPGSGGIAASYSTITSEKYDDEPRDLPSPSRVKKVVENYTSSSKATKSTSSSSKDAYVWAAIIIIVVVIIVVAVGFFFGLWHLSTSSKPVRPVVYAHLHPQFVPPTMKT